MNLIVNKNNIRLDKYISLNTDYSRELVNKMIDNNYIFVNDTIKKASYIVKENDNITILPGFIQESKLEKT